VVIALSGTERQRQGAKSAKQRREKFQFDEKLRLSLAILCALGALALPFSCSSGEASSAQIRHRALEHRQAVALLASRKRGPAGVLRPGDEAFGVRH
jgi:hypothetical protein